MKKMKKTTKKTKMMTKMTKKSWTLIDDASLNGSSFSSSSLVSSLSHPLDQAGWTLVGKAVVPGSLRAALHRSLAAS